MQYSEGRLAREKDSCLNYSLYHDFLNPVLMELGHVVCAQRCLSHAEKLYSFHCGSISLEKCLFVYPTGENIMSCEN